MSKPIGGNPLNKMVKKLEEETFWESLTPIERRYCDLAKWGDYIASDRAFIEYACGELDVSPEGLAQISTRSSGNRNLCRFILFCASLSSVMMSDPSSVRRR